MIFTFFQIIAGSVPGGYQPLAPIQGFIDQSAVQQSTTQSLGFYVNELFRVGIAAAGFLAVIMIIYGGIQYVGSDVVSTKSEAKKKIQDAILGLLLALSSYLILKTINQDFLATDLRIEKVTVDVSREAEASYIGAPTTAANLGLREGTDIKKDYVIDGSGNRISLTGIPTRDGRNIQIDSSIQGRVNDLFGAFGNQPGLNMVVTEGYAASGHVANCHAQGTCIDINFTNRSQDPILIAQAIIAGESVGARLVYEMPPGNSETVNRVREIISNYGIDPNRAITVNHATGSHFSVYFNRSRGR